VKEASPCPKCRAEVPAGARFCGSCGAPVVRAIPCPGCKTEVPAGAKFCMNCGRKIEEEKV
jgi:predicted amidophosphoribosyltransferase